MFARRSRAALGASPTPGLGIGALVRVVNDGRGDMWDGEPIGVVVAPGGNQIAAYPGVGQQVSWTVAFDGHAWTVDGRGPFERATIRSGQLVALPVTDAEIVDAEYETL
jgi:hypothetical protein